jgi:DNA helicase HerA-like ATPase
MTQPTSGTPIGLVAAPIGQESTTTRFFFWVERDQLVEKTQLVRVTSSINGQEITWYGTVEEVFRRSRKRSMDEEVDLFDGDLNYTPPFGPEGVTFAEVAVLTTEPPLLTPPREQSLVMLGDEADVAAAWSYNEMIDDFTDTDWNLPIGLIRNGGQGTVGVAKIDLRDLNGERAGHLNVTGQAGRGTKSSFLTVVVRALIDKARQLDDGNTKRPPFAVRPIIFNVKGNDLMYIDLPNRYLTDEHRTQWQRMGIKPRPFEGAKFHSPCQSGSGEINRGVPRVMRPVEQERQTLPYYWTLEDIVRFGLWEYLFSEDVQQSEPMMAFVGHLLGEIAEPCLPSDDYPAGLKLRTGAEAIRSFHELRDELDQSLQNTNHRFRSHGVHTFGTIRALMSRLRLVLSDEGRSIFAHDERGHGQPLQVTAPGTTDPIVIDIAMLPHELRRFVVAAVLDQVKRHQMEHRIPGQVYFLVLDELGIYAPRSARDPITKLFEHVAAQLRSQGIILLSAQQQASTVSETIFGNSQFKVIGASSPVEIDSPAWSRLLSGPQKTRALMLRPEEKMVLLDRGWMNVVVPFPAWAMKESEAAITTTNELAGASTNGFKVNLPDE